MMADALDGSSRGFLGSRSGFCSYCGGFGPELGRWHKYRSGAELLEESLVVGFGERPQFAFRDEGFRRDGYLVPKYSLYRLHLYIIFRLYKGCFRAIFVKWCKGCGMLGWPADFCPSILYTAS